MERAFLTDTALSRRDTFDDCSLRETPTEVLLTLIAEFGQRALSTDDPDALVKQVLRALSEVLDFEYCRLLELAADGHSLIVRAVAGWPSILIGQPLTDLESTAKARQALVQRAPVLIEGGANVGRYIACGVEVLVPGPHGPVGVLGVHSRSTRPLSGVLVSLLRSFANVIGCALARERDPAATLQQSR